MNANSQEITAPNTRPFPFTYADLILKYLIRIGVDYIYGVPGGAIEPLYNAIARNQRHKAPQESTSSSIMPMRKSRGSSALQAVIARHEAGAAFMADGYARETGKLGVCCATTGPGATNLITGVASAYADRIPMLVITPQTALPDFGKLGLQESSSDAIDIVGMFEHCTRYNSLISHPEQLEVKLYTALINAFREPRGPVHLSIPMDIMKTPVESRNGSHEIAHLFRQPKVIDEQAYGLLFDQLQGSKRTVLLVGGGCQLAIDEITALAQLLNSKIISTPSGKRWLNAYHPLYHGVFGFAGHQSATDAIMDDNVDTILAIGTSLGELSTSSWNKILLNPKLIHITQFPDDFSRSLMARLHVQGELQTIFRSLVNDFNMLQRHSKTSQPTTVLETPRNDQKPGYAPTNITLNNQAGCYSDAIPLKPQRVMRELVERFPAKSRFITDAGNIWAWSTHYLLQKEIGLHRVAFGFGAMGWAVGAAVGTAMGVRQKQRQEPDKIRIEEQPTLCLTGDGSFLMSGQEITTAVAEQLPVIFVVLNDQALGMVKHGQRLGGAEPIGFDLPPVDFAAMANAMGATGIALRTPEDFSILDIDAICSRNGPTLVDIHIDPEEVPPIGARVQTLGRGNH